MNRMRLDKLYFHFIFYLRSQKPFGCGLADNGVTNLGGQVIMKRTTSLAILAGVLMGLATPTFAYTALAFPQI